MFFLNETSMPAQETFGRQITWYFSSKNWAKVLDEVAGDSWTGGAPNKIFRQKIERTPWQIFSNTIGEIDTFLLKNKQELLRKKVFLNFKKKGR